MSKRAKQNTPSRVRFDADTQLTQTQKPLLRTKRTPKTLPPILLQVYMLTHSTLHSVKSSLNGFLHVSEDKDSVLKEVQHWVVSGNKKGAGK